MRRRNDPEIPFETWIPAHAVLFHDDGAVSLMTEALQENPGNNPEPRYWVQVAEMIVIGDIGFYSVHRAFYTVPWLWKFHQIHHSIEELDWLAAARVHPIDQILTKGASLLPIFAPDTLASTA